MASGRNTIGADVFDKNLGYVSILSNQLIPTEYFSEELAEFCNHAAYHCDVHTISMPIVLLNIAATSTGKSGIWRSNTERLPLNLYSLIVANSSFGKSKLLRLIAHGLQVINDHHPEKFKSADGNKGNCPVYNDATCAGIIASVNGCTRVLISEEADVLLPSIGAVLPSPFVNKDIPAVKSDARAEIMKMFDGDLHIRKLKGSIYKMDSFKHSFVGASSGGIIVTALQRKSNASMVDPFFERLMIWCLRPEPLMFVPECQKEKPELHRFPTLEEFCVILGFFDNFEMFYDNEGDKIMVNFGNRYTMLAYNEADRYLSAKMGKMIQLTHGLVGLLQVLEWTWKIVEEYLKINDYFTGLVSEEFMWDIRNIFNRLYESNINNKCNFVANATSVKHAINISEALLEQYKVLMRLPDDVIPINSSNSNNLKAAVAVQAPLNGKLEKSKKKFDEHIRDALLFKSVIFTPTTLYKKSSAFKHYSENGDSVLKQLVSMGLLIAFQDGIVSRTKKAVVYAKWLPNVNDEIECQRFERMLATFNDNNISADSVVRATTIASLLPHKAIPRSKVWNYLKSDRYSRLNLNINTNSVDQEGSSYQTALVLMTKHEIFNLDFDIISEMEDNSNSSSIFTKEKDLTTSINTEPRVDNNGITGQQDECTVISDSANDGLAPVQQKMDVTSVKEYGTQSSIVVENIFDTIGSSQVYNHSSKRKINQRSEYSSGDNSANQRDVRARSSNEVAEQY